MRKDWKKALGAALWTLKWLLLAALVGLVCGLAGTGFHLALEKAGELFGKHGWLLYLMPAAGAAIVLLYRLGRMPLNVGTDRVFESTRGEEGVPAQMAPLIFAGTFLTHLTGGSAGREGAALQLGGSLACLIGRGLRLNEKEMRVIGMCGMAALFSALFGTPVAAAFFAIEVVDVGRVHYRALFPCALSSLCAWELSRELGASATRFALEDGLMAAGPWALARLIVLAAACGLMAILFCKVMHVSSDAAKKLLANDYLRTAACALIVIALTLILGTRDYNGAGMGVIRRALAGDAKPFAWALKLVFTAVTLAGGFRGGEIVPTFFVGATFGCVLGPLLGLDPCLSAAVSMAALFAGVTNAPVASVLIAAEMFGGKYLALFALACAVSYLVSGKCSLYHSQRFWEEKYISDKE